MPRYLVATLSVLATLAFASPAFAERYAILIGVAQYDDIHIRDLAGPANDVALIRQVLEGLPDPIRQITVLSDMDGATPPTLANIVAALENAAATAKDGDYFYIHFAGHGSFKLDTTGDELDGFDEVFLPRDTVILGERPNQTFENDLDDDTLRVLLADIRNKGADVFLVVDSCHSGTMTRTADAAFVARQVELGIDVNRELAIAPLDVELTADDNLAANAGGLVAFYAAQPTEFALEYQETARDGTTRGYGVFSRALANRLGQHPGITYEQLFQAVMFDLNRGSIARPQTPMMEGTFLNAGILGTTAIADATTDQFPVNTGVLQAGSLSGMAPGTILALFRDPAEAFAARLGYARVVSSDTFEARLELVVDACVGANVVPTNCTPATDQGPLNDARFARVVAPAVDLVLRIGTPIDLACPVAGNCPPPEGATEIAAALAALAEKPAAELGAVIELDSPEPQLALGIRDGRLWLVLGAGFGQFGEDEPPTAISWDPFASAGAETALDQLVGIVQGIVKVHRLVSLYGALGATGGESPLQVTVSVAPSDPIQLAALAPAELDGLFAECDRAQTTETQPLREGEFLKQCDHVTIEGAITGGADARYGYSLNIIRIDPLMGISVVSRQIQGAVGATFFEDLSFVCSNCGGAATAQGLDRILVVVTENTDGQTLNLERWAQAPVRTVVATRGPELAGLIWELLTPDAGTRGSFGQPRPAGAWVQDFTWTTVPRSIAVAAQ